MMTVAVTPRTPGTRQERTSGAHTEIQGLLDLAVTLRARLQFDALVGAEIEAGVGYALIGRASALLSWHEWWVPMRAAITVRLP